MAYKVSKEYKNIIYSGGAVHKAILTINGIEIPNNQIQSIEISDPLIDNQQKIFYLGQFASKQIIIKFKNIDGIPIEGNVELSIGTLINDEWEIVPIGKFLIETNTEDYYTNNKLTCLDYAVKMKSNCDYSELINDEEGNITPISLENLLIWICNHYGVELGTYPETNKDYLISTYDSTLSGKYYISLIAELMGSNAHFGRDGKLYIIPIKQSSTEQINALKSKSFNSTSTYTISKVIFDDGTRKVELGNDDNNTLFIRNDNLFVLDEHEALINNIYESVKGTRIDSIAVENYGDVSLDCFDIITYQLEEETYLTLHNSKITYEQVLMGKIETIIPTENQTSTTNQFDGNVDSKIRRIQSQVNQLDGSLKIIAEESLETNKLVSELEVSVEGISNTVSQTSTNLENTKQELINELNNKASADELVTITNEVTKLQTSTSETIKIVENIQTNGVSQVRTENSFTFDKDGLHLEEEGAKTNSTLNNKGLDVQDAQGSKQDLLYAGYVNEEKAKDNNGKLEKYEGQTIVYSENMWVDRYFMIGTHSRLEDFEDGTGVFYLGG